MKIIIINQSTKKIIINIKMDKLINDINNQLAILSLNESNESSTSETSISESSISESSVIKIQKLARGYICRKNRLPNIMYSMRNYLKSCNIIINNTNKDGRINSCCDEDTIINLLSKKYVNKIKIPNARMWYDLLVYDHFYGWLPVNIKTSTLKSSDNVGNLATCVYAYTDEILDIYKSYRNGKMSIILYDKIKNKQYNKNLKKDYYFLVINKNDPTDIIINSIKGLTTLKPNINNLPFQICWKNNRDFNYQTIDLQIKKLIECLKKPEPSWQETFMKNMRLL